MKYNTIIYVHKIMTYGYPIKLKAYFQWVHGVKNPGIQEKNNKKIKLLYN